VTIDPASDLLKEIVRTWNDFVRPVTEESIQRSIEDVVQKFGGRPIGPPSQGFNECLRAMLDCRDMEPQLFGRLCDDIGKRLPALFLRFVGCVTRGGALLALDRPIEALHFYLRADRFWFDQFSEEFHCDGSASALIAVEQWEAAIKRLDRALDLADRRSGGVSTGAYLENQGIAYCMAGDLEEAKRRYQEAVKISESTDDGFLTRRRQNLVAIEAELAQRSSTAPRRSAAGMAAGPMPQRNSREASISATEDAAQNPSEQFFSVGDRFGGRYLIRKIMRGRMGIVYLLEDQNARGPFEPKYLCAKTFYSHFLEPAVARRIFIEEVETWLRLGRYEHILWAYDYQVVGGKPYALVQYADAGTLRERVESGFCPQKSVLDMSMAVIFGFGIALGMKKIYQTVNTPHGDLSIDNILLAEGGGLIKIADFGLAAVASRSRARSVQRDVIQFGEVLWYLFTGREDHGQVILDQMSSEMWLDPRICSVIRNCITSNVHDGQAFFAETAAAIDRYAFATWNIHLPTPEQHREEKAREISAVAAKILGPIAEVDQVNVSPFAEPVAAVINRGAAFIDLELADEASVALIEALQHLKSRRDTREAQAIWRNLRLLMSKMADSHRLREQAFDIWREEVPS
jgi:tetratricopeptide repeat protein/protein tyrosine kinase